MPGNVAAAVASAVVPSSLCSVFRETRAWQVRESGGYADGRYQAEVQAESSRKSWEIGKLLTFAQWLALSQFFDTRNGAQKPFYWYPNIADYDPIGSYTTGRYLVRFDGALSRTYRLGRQEASLRLIEIE
ncbi:MAG: hypothetical protein IH602_07605 [Bryobacteraceae bacterium]|nr:hypothetical protein [Bryobacteraceae bacterium]